MTSSIIDFIEKHIISIILFYLIFIESFIIRYVIKTKDKNEKNKGIICGIAFLFMFPCAILPNANFDNNIKLYILISVGILAFITLIYSIIRLIIFFIKNYKKYN